MHHCLFLVLWDHIYFIFNLSSLYKVWYEFFCFKFGRIFLHFIKACPDLPWLDQIYCSGYKLYCRRYWPDLPEMCRKWLPRKKTDRPNNFCQSAFFLRSFCFPPTTLTDVCLVSDFSAKNVSDLLLQRMAIKVLEEVFIPRPGIFSQGEFRGSDFFHQFQNKFPPHLGFSPQCFEKKEEMGRLCFNQLLVLYA